MKPKERKQMAMMKKGWLVFVLSVLFSLSSSYAQGPPADPGVGEPKEIPVERIGDGIFRLGEIQIHKKAGSVTFPAIVNMDKGLLEYLMVRSTGKTHESLLRTDMDPYYLNIAFLLLGLEGTDSPLAEQGVSDTPKGEKVTIRIVYRKGKKNVTVAAESWIEQRTHQGKAKSPSMQWIYTGSLVQQGVFLAKAMGSIVAIYHDPAALIDHATPGGDNDEVWFVKEGKVPAAGTPVTVVIKAVD